MVSKKGTNIAPITNAILNINQWTINVPFHAYQKGIVQKEAKKNFNIIFHISVFEVSDAKNFDHDQ